MQKTLPTYPDLAARYGVTLCGACDISPSAHRSGMATKGTVHWSRVRPHRPGLGQFLAVVWDARNYGHEPMWDRLYQRSRWAQAQARELKVRVPARIWEDSKLAVRYIFAGHVKDAPPDVKRWMQQWHV